MITELVRSILYFCPDCSQISTDKISAFNISGRGAYCLHCSDEDCGKELIKFSAKRNKYEICVECPVCGEHHIFNITQKTMWSKDFFILNCPASGFGILFIGKDTERLRSEYNAQNELIAGIIAGNDADYGELDILFDIIEILNDFALSDAIKCSCGSSRISINLDHNNIMLVCRDCGKHYSLPATAEELDRLCDTDSLTLK